MPRGASPEPARGAANARANEVLRCLAQRVCVTTRARASWGSAGPANPALGEVRGAGLGRGRAPEAGGGQWAGKVVDCEAVPARTAAVAGTERPA
jgi:hypothetical protein